MQPRDPEELAIADSPVPPGRWNPIRMSELAAVDATVDWILEGYIAPRTSTLLTGLWKVGKTTLLAALLQALGNDQEFAGRRVRRTRVLVVSEEGTMHWVRRRDALGIDDHVELLARPFKGRASNADWRDFAIALAALVKDRQYSLVVFDSLPNLWPVTDENDAPQVIGAMSEVSRVADAGAAILCVAHPKKGDAGEGQATRGSGALPAYVDVILELRRLDGHKRDDSRRKLTAYSRFEETPPELIIDYRDGAYVAVGTRQDARTADRLAVLLGLLSSSDPGATVEELLATWPDEDRPSKKTLERLLHGAVERGAVKQTGKGVRGDSFRFMVAATSSDVAGGELAGIETQDEANAHALPAAEQVLVRDGGDEAQMDAAGSHGGTA